MNAENSISPVSYNLQVNRLPKRGVEIIVEADEKQRILLAEEHGLIAVDSFIAKLSVKPWKADGILVRGRVKALIKQACVLTLEPIEAKVDEEIKAVFIPATSRLARIREDQEIIIDPDADDLPETFVGDSVDLGLLAEEFFELGIDAYPRKQNVILAENEIQSEKPEESSPFYEELKKLREK